MQGRLRRFLHLTFRAFYWYGLSDTHWWVLVDISEDLQTHNWPANEGKPNRYRYHVMNWQCYSAHTQLHVMYMITYWLPLTCYLLVCSVSSHTAAIETKLMSQHSFTLYIIAMQYSKRHNSEILCLHPGMGSTRKPFRLNYSELNCSLFLCCVLIDSYVYSFIHV